MSNNEYFENKVEEALQLLSAHSELLEKQILLMEELIARISNVEAERSLNEYLQEAPKNKKVSEN